MIRLTRFPRTAYRARTLRASALLATLALALFSCTPDESPIRPEGDPETFRDLEVKSLGGRILYHTNPLLPIRDRYSVQVILLMRNRSRYREFSGLSIPNGDLFLHSTLEPLGSVPFATMWDGSVRAFDSVRVVLTNDASKQQWIEAKCDLPAYFNLRLVADSRNSKVVTTDSLIFECVE